MPEYQAKRSSTLVVFVCGFLLPQTVLILLNWYSWMLVADEATDQELRVALGLWGLELVIWLANVVVAWFIATRKYEPEWKAICMALFLHTLYMLLVLFYVEAAIPNSIQRWILTEENVGRWNVTLMMPGAFLSLYALVKRYYSRMQARQRGLLALGAIFGVPVSWYLLATILQPFLYGQLSVIVSIVVGTLSVMVFLAAVIHVFDSLLHKHFAQRGHVKHYVVVAGLLGLAAPLAGLTLNDNIPFPVNFQSTGVYVLTVLNGLVLLIRPDVKQLNATVLFLRCLTLPFIFYFFFVFLPFLPLSILAILAIGLGFLMLTPLALGLFQMRVTLDAYAQCRPRVGAAKANALVVAGLLVLPGYFAVQAWADKMALDTSLEYFYSHEMSGETLSSGQATRAAGSLVQLRDRKEGVQLPYISGFYNRIVFGDLVLSDQKISRMYRLLLGQPIPEKVSSLFSGRSGSAWDFRTANVVPPTTDVGVDEIGQSRTSVGSSTVKLLLKNPTEELHSMYVGRLQIPQGVFVTGLRLKIEGQWVDGQIFDRKTALWVFQKITEVRRDPALLYYTSATQAELRVYPFPAQGVREVEIDFSYHPAAQARVGVDKEKLDLNPSVSWPAVLSTNGNVLMSQQLPHFAWQRQAYLHVVLDFSQGSSGSVEQYLASITRIGAQLGLTQVRLSGANIALSDTSGLLAIDDTVQIRRFIESIALQKSGGLWVQQALAKEILRVQTTDAEETLHEYPVFVVVGDTDGSASNAISEEIGLTEMGIWGSLIPDWPYWYSYFGGELKTHCLHDNCAKGGANLEQSVPVVVLKKGRELIVLPADSSALIPFSSAQSVQVYDPPTKQFVALAPPDKHNTPDSYWPRAAQAWMNWRNASINPATVEAERSILLSSSRDLGLLIPVTSFIVVESPSQWEILRRKEQQSLANHSGLDFEEEEEQQTPEPAWWILLALLCAYLYFKDAKDKRRAHARVG